MAKDNGIKRTWMVCGDVTDALWDDKAEAPKEFKTLAAALTEAKQLVQTTENTEAWVYALTHVISRPTTDPVIDVVK